MKIKSIKLCILCDKEIIIPCNDDRFLQGNKYIFRPVTNEGMPRPKIDSIYYGKEFHWECYLNWPQQKQFAKQQFIHYCSKAKKNTLCGLLHKDDRLIVSVSVIKPFNLRMCFSSVGNEIFVSIDKWEQFSINPQVATDNFYSKEFELVKSSLLEIVQLYPNKQAVISNTDWNGTEKHLYVD